MTKRYLRKDKGACVQCTACVAQCRSGALSIARPSDTVHLDRATCIACGWCVDACGYGALRLARSALERAGAA